MVNKPLIGPYFLGGVALGGAARIPLKRASFDNLMIHFPLLRITPPAPGLGVETEMA